MLSLFHTAGAGNLSSTAGDGFLHNGRGEHLAIQHNSDLFTNIASGQVSKFFTALIAKFQTYHSLITLGYLSSGILQILTGHNYLTIDVLELQHSSTAQHGDSLFRVLNTRKLYNDTILALTLNYRLGQTQLVDTAFDDFHTAVDSIIVHLQVRCIHRLQNNVGTALQIQTLLNRVSQGGDVDAETADYSQGDNQKFPQLIPTQNNFLLKNGFF